DGAGGAEAEPGVAVRIVARALDLGLELDRARDAADLELAVDAELVRLELLDRRALERDLGMIGGIEEVLALQVPRELGLLGDEVLDAHGAGDGADRAVIGDDAARSAREAAAERRDAEVL